MLWTFPGSTCMSPYLLFILSTKVRSMARGDVWVVPSASRTLRMSYEVYGFLCFSTWYRVGGSSRCLSWSSTPRRSCVDFPLWWRTIFAFSAFIAIWVVRA
jgi:hypothetical protein